MHAKLVKNCLLQFQLIALSWDSMACIHMHVYLYTLSTENEELFIYYPNEHIHHRHHLAVNPARMCLIWSLITVVGEEGWKAILIIWWFNAVISSYIVGRGMVKELAHH